MLAILKAPFPPHFSERNSLWSAVAVGIFVGLFLFLFKPFGIGDSEEMAYPFLKYFGLGLMSFLGVIFVDIILPKLYPSFFEEKNYTVTSEIITGVITIFTIAIFNISFLTILVGDHFTYRVLLIMLWQVFLIGIFPLGLMTFIKYNRLLNSNMKISSEIEIPKAPLAYAERRESLPSVTIPVRTSSPADNKDQELDLTGLLYMESVGNYVNVTTNKDGELTRNLIRNTLKSMELDSQNSHIRRCHRSYIVNLSRKYISDVKDYFSQTKATLASQD